jgi:hypothetical protein
VGEGGRNTKTQVALFRFARPFFPFVHLLSMFFDPIGTSGLPQFELAYLVGKVKKERRSPLFLSWFPSKHRKVAWAGPSQ